MKHKYIANNFLTILIIFTIFLWTKILKKHLCSRFSMDE